MKVDLSNYKDEQLISYETASLSKKMGFNLRCHYYSYQLDDILYQGEYINHNKEGEFISEISRPRQSLLQKWLREKHGLHIEILLEEDHPYNKFYFRVMEIGKYFTLSHSDIYCDTYEGALEIGLIEALLLIKK